MIKKTFLLTLLAALTFSTIMTSVARAETSYVGQIVKIEGKTTLYYVASDGQYYIFPNEKTYKSWFNDFSDVTIITQEELDEIPLAGNIRYRPGVLLVKFTESPKVYTVSVNGLLRWVKTEKLARKFYGENWSLLLDDIPITLHGNYNIGDPIDEEEDYDADEEVSENNTIDQNRGLKLGHLDPALKAKTVKCRAVRAEPARPHEGKNRATPAISARACKLAIINEADNGDETDEEAPEISDITTTTATSTATITWITNEEATSKVEYADESLDTASTTDVVIESDLVTAHSLELENLTPDTIYYFMVQSADAASNIATSTEQTFVTQAESEPADETAPDISDISVTATTTTATITWTTDEDSDSEVEYADESLDTTSSTESVSDSNLITSHSIELADLTASTTYYFIVKSTDASNNKTESAEDNFTTTE